MGPDSSDFDPIFLQFHFLATVKNDFGSGGWTRKPPNSLDAPMTLTHTFTNVANQVCTNVANDLFV